MTHYATVFTLSCTCNPSSRVSLLNSIFSSEQVVDVYAGLNKKGGRKIGHDVP